MAMCVRSRRACEGRVRMWRWAGVQYTARASSCGLSGRMTATAVIAFSTHEITAQTAICASHGRHEGGWPYSPLRK